MAIRYLSVSTFSAMKANSLQTVAMCNAFAERIPTSLHFFDDDGSEEAALRTRLRPHPSLRLVPVRRRRFPALEGFLNLLRMTYGAAKASGPGDTLYTREIFLALVASLFSVPFFLEHHLDLREKWYSLLMGWISRSRRFVAHVPISASMIPSLGLTGCDPRKILVLHDGVDLSAFDGRKDGRSIRARLGIPEDRFVAGYCGQLFPEKGADFVLDLGAAAPGMTFLLVGGEPRDLARLGAVVKDRKLANVLLAGRVDHGEVPDWLAACDCFLLPNTVNYYMSPLKLFEYMASGRPVLASDFPPFREVVEPGVTGLLATPNDAASFVAALESLRRDADLRAKLSSAAREKVEREFTWQARVERILAARASVD